MTATQATTLAMLETNASNVIRSTRQTLSDSPKSARAVLLRLEGYTTGVAEATNVPSENVAPLLRTIEEEQHKYDW